jgi:RNA polymerase sigma-70 factor (family 1)
VLCHFTKEAFEALRQGREEGLKFFFDEYYAALTWFGKSFIHDEALAQDLASDAFVKLWEKRECLEHSQAVKSYLYQTVKNAAVDALRRKKLALAHQLNARALAENIEQEVYSRELESETYRQLYLALEALPPAAGKVLAMDMDGKSYREIASLLNISIHTVRNQKARAVSLLRQRLAKQILPFLLVVAGVVNVS